MTTTATATATARPAPRARVVTRAKRRARASRRPAPGAPTTRNGDADDDDDGALDDVERAVFDRASDAVTTPEPVAIDAMREIERANARAMPAAERAREEAFRTMMARAKAREDKSTAAERALSVDSLLVFGADGVLPELVNARVAMFGVLTGVVVEVTTGKSFIEQLAWNATHGVSELVAGAVILASCLPSFRAESDGETIFGSGACKWRRDKTARAERGYLVDPLNLDVRTLPGKDTVLGRVGWVPFVELLNGRLAMITIIVLFAGEPLLGHPFFTSP